jgi:hypothetical protein
MANSELQGKEVKIPDKIKNHLSKIYNAYKGDKTIEGYSRLKNLKDESSITYESLKRIKNYFDNYTGNKKDTPYLLNGGTIMKQWVEETLENLRQDVYGKKKIMSDIGMENQFNKTHTRDNLDITDTHSSTNDKNLRNENIYYNINMINNLINKINKNKQLWHKESHQY